MKMYVYAGVNLYEYVCVLGRARAICGRAAAAAAAVASCPRRQRRRGVRASSCSRLARTPLRVHFRLQAPTFAHRLSSLGARRFRQW